MQKKFSNKSLWLSFIFLIGLLPGNSQTTMIPDGQFHTLYYNPNDKVQELKIPDDMTGGRIYLEGIGADGGIKKNYREGPNLRAEGGEGAVIGAWFEIGLALHQIPPGATILFIIGEKGQDEWAVTPSQAGGGGGTGILFQPNPSSGYSLLIVAGGGGGGAADCCLVQVHGKPGEIIQCVIDNGLPYNPYGKETYCYDSRTVYQDQYHCHRAGSVWDDNSDASYFAGQDYDATPCECTGQAGWPGSERGREYNNPVKPTGGGMYGNCEGRPSGGFGFGSGAPGKKNLSTESSGGGGYTVSSTSGGGSFITDHFSMDQNEELYLQRGTTRNPEHGNVRYKIIPAPKAVCSDLEVSLPATGTQAFAYFVMAYGSTTTIPGENLLVAEVQSQELLTTLDCADIGTQVINMEIIGTISGYGTQCTANLTVKDEISPVISCKDISISTAANGHASFSTASLLDTYTDNCSTSPASLTADKNSFTYDCNFDGQTLTESVKVTATDDSGNSKDCNATVTIAVTSMDSLPPIASCKDIAVQLGSQGQLTITPDAVDQGSSDPCSGNITNYQFGQSRMELQVESEGFNADLSWTITSLDGNTIFAERPSYSHDSPSPGIAASETSFLEEINLAPGCYLFNWVDSHGDGFWCYGETNFYHLTNSNGETLAYGECAEIGYGQSTEFCIEPDSFVDELVLDCDDIGYYSASLVLTDPSGNTSSCQSVVTVKGGPQAVCKPVTVQLSPEGSASLLATSIDAGSSSNCGNITSYQFGQSRMELQVESEGFNADLSWTITSLDGGTIYAERPSYPHDSPSPGISASETSFLEEIPLAPGCYLFNWIDSHGDGFWCYGETNFYHLINSNGETLAYGECAEIGFGQSTEFCIEPDTFVDELTFECDDIGEYLAALYVTDVAGISANCQTTIKVEGYPIQEVQCPPDPVVIQLDEDGLASLSVEQVIYGETLSCQVGQYSLSKTEFDCQKMGTNLVTLTAHHPNGSISSCEAMVKVRDDILPIPSCKDITASLGDNGTVTLDASLADNGSTDICGIYDLYFGDYNPTRTFDCEDVGVHGYFDIIVEDYAGNLAYCGITLTIKDETPPLATCKDLTIQLDANGMANIAEDAINNNSSDYCGLANLDTDITDFTCDDLGDNLVVLTIEDLHGNQSTCEALVTVEDPIFPIALCQDITIDLGADGMATLNPVNLDGGSTDNCGIETFIVSTTSLDRTNIGNNSVSLSVVDAGGNTSSCTAIVTVNPVLIAYSWDDQDGDGKQDANEPSLPGIPVAIIDHSSNAPIQEGTTNEDGEAIFSVPSIAPNQQIKLLFTEVADHRFTLKDKGNNDLIDSDVGRSNGITKVFNLETDGLTEQWDAGLWAPAEIQATVWDDQDGDGKQDEGEPGLAGAQVDLLESDGTILSSTTTNDEGLATFVGAPANRPVKLKFYELPDLSFTLKDKGNNDNIDSDASRSNGLTATFQANKGSQRFDSWDAGMLSAGRVLAFVWDDLDGDGKQDAGEPAIEGAQVDLLESDNSLIQSGQTDVSGVATFLGIPTDRSVKLQFFEKKNHRFTLKDQGNNDNIDSDASRSNGMTSTFQASTGAETVEQWDAGLWSPGRIEARVWDDQDGDGKQDADEPFIEGVQVNLLESDGTLLGSALSRSDGIISLSAVPANRPIKLQFMELANFRYTLKDQGNNDNIDSDPSRSNGMTATFQATRGNQVFDNWDAGLWSPGIVEAFVWDDLDGDGKQDEGEPGISNAPVNLLESNGELIASSNTNDDGIAIFQSVPADRAIKLQFFEPVDHRFSLKDKGGNDNIDSDASRSNGMTATFQAQQGSQKHQKMDAGLWSPGEIQAFVWDDLDGDGKQDDDEPALVGAQVELLENDNSAMLTTTTDENGIATIFDVPANRSVKLRFTALEGYSLTKKDKGNDNIDSDAKPSNGLTASFSVNKGQQLFTEWDAGMINSNQNALTANPTNQAPASYETEDHGLNLKVVTNHLKVYPNPFSNQTKIEFNLSKWEQVSLSVYNQHGQLINQLIDSELEPGKHQRLWNGSAFGGAKLPAGIYFLRLQVGEKWITEKVSLVRN